MEPYGIDVLILDIPLCCHISLPYIMAFDIKVSHQII